jgi:hypothetical protein
LGQKWRNGQAPNDGFRTAAGHHQGLLAAGLDEMQDVIVEGVVNCCRH